MSSCYEISGIYLIVSHTVTSVVLHFIDWIRSKHQQYIHLTLRVWWSSRVCHSVRFTDQLSCSESSTLSYHVLNYEPFIMYLTLCWIAHVCHGVSCTTEFCFEMWPQWIPISELTMDCVSRGIWDGCLLRLRLRLRSLDFLETCRAIANCSEASRQQSTKIQYCSIMYSMLPEQYPNWYVLCECVRSFSVINRCQIDAKAGETVSVWATLWHLDSFAFLAFTNLLCSLSIVWHLLRSYKSQFPHKLFNADLERRWPPTQ